MPRVEGGGVRIQLPDEPRVMIVDDNHDMADALATLLTTEGYAVEVAYGALHALKVARRFRPAVALLDIGLPEMDGYALARRMQRARELRHLKLVAITGYGQSEDRRRALDAGFLDHLVKPVEFEAIAQVIARHIKKKPPASTRRRTRTRPGAWPRRRRPAPSGRGR